MEICKYLTTPVSHIFFIEWPVILFNFAIFTVLELFLTIISEIDNGLLVGPLQLPARVWPVRFRVADAKWEDSSDRGGVSKPRHGRSFARAGGKGKEGLL